MTKENRETLERAAGIIEGVYYVVSERAQNALSVAVDMIDGILDSEERE